MAWVATSCLVETRLQGSDGQWKEAGARLQAGDRQAFAEVFQHFYPPLVRYASGIVGDAATAADVVQDCFAKLWAEHETLAVRVSLKALLYTMVRNRALNARRRQHRFATDAEDSRRDEAERHAGSPGGADTLAAERLREQIVRWIEALPPRRREAFMLSRYHGLAHSEIAAIMGVSDRTVDTHMLLALRELRRRLDAWRDA